MPVGDTAHRRTYYAYDAADRVSGVRDGLGRWERYEYDPVSNLRKRLDGSGNVTYYSYDAVNRRTGTKRPDGGYAYFSYDAVGKMVSARDEEGWTYFDYDAVDRLTGTTLPRGGTVRFGYDAAGRRRKVESEAGCPYYLYDEMGRPAQVLDVLTASWGSEPWGASGYGGAATEVGTASYAWDAASRMTKQAQGNGQVTYFTYDRANRLTARKTILPDGRALTYFEYAYDAAGRTAKVAREGGKTAYYAWDAADRLTGEHWYGGAGTPAIYAFEWSYDGAGNRVGEVRNGVTTQYEYDAANELRKAHDATSAQTTYFEYDPNGNCRKTVAAAGTTYFAYDSRDLQTRITFRTGITNYFRYDALGRRTALVDSAGAAYFTYDADGLCHPVEYDAAGAVTARHTRGISPVPGIGDLLASKVERNGTAYFQYPAYDPRGNVHRLVNEAGIVTGYFEYDAWGRYLRNTPPPEGTRFGPSAPAWIILRDDPDNLFSITPTRTAHRGVGRFLQRDVLFATNRYIMWGDSPASLVDPDGREVFHENGTPIGSGWQEWPVDKSGPIYRPTARPTAYDRDAVIVDMVSTVRGHWFSGGGRTLTRSDDEWARFMQEHPAVQSAAFQAFLKKAEIIAGGNVKAGAFTTSPATQAIIDDTYMLRMTFNYVDYYATGNFHLNIVDGRKRVTFTNTRHIIRDIMSSNTWGDWLTIDVPMVFGSFHQGLGLSDWSAFDPFLVEISWAGEEIVFEERNGVLRLKGKGRSNVNCSRR